MKTILTVAAHPDDEILGAGGTIRKLVDEGAQAFALILGEGATSRTESRAQTDRATISDLHGNCIQAASCVGYKEVFFADLPDNRFDSVDLLDVVKIVERHIRSVGPYRIFTHHGGDLNIDHRVACAAVVTASRPVKGCPVRRICCFETLSSTEWAFMPDLAPFCPNCFVDIGETGLAAKLSAMQCYMSELAEYPHPRSLKAIEAAATKWGSTAGVYAAEAFQSILHIE
jgi:LmbE family N-acetylglucosaminyl deacetylase